VGTVDYQRITRKGKKRKKRKGPPLPKPDKAVRLTWLQVLRANNRKDAVILPVEASLELADLMAFKFGHCAWFKSKVSNPQTRVHRLVDREIVKKMGDIVDKGEHVALAANDLRVVLKEKGWRSSKKHPEKRAWAPKTTRRAISRFTSRIARKCIKKVIKAGEPIRVIATDHWDRASPVLKMLGYAGAITATNGRAFSLNLGQEVIDAGLRSRKGFAGFMQERMRRTLRELVQPKTGFVPDVFFIVEGYRSLEELHLHGVFDADNRGYRPRPLGDDLVDHISDALKAIGGKQTDPTKQLMVRPITNLPGWIDYISKRMLTTAEDLTVKRALAGFRPIVREESLVGATLNLRRRGRTWYQAARKKQNTQDW
jgi:hypothetical protein